MTEPRDPLDAPFRGHQPLTDDDPVQVADFWLDSRLTTSPAGTAYAAHEDHSDEVMLLLLSQGAAADHAARARFAGEINAMHIDTVVARGGEGQDEGRMSVRYRSDSDAPQIDVIPLAPWAALAFDGSKRAVAEADRVLHAVDLATTPPLGDPSGPDYNLHWAEDRKPGNSRAWPLSWPARRDRAGWITILISWLLMLLLAALGLLLAILIFQNAPLVSPPPPIPSEASESGGGDGSGEPQSGEPSSGEPQSGQPSESDQGAPPTEDFTPEMGDPSDSESGEGGETPNRRL